MTFLSSASRRFFTAGFVLLGLSAAHQARAEDYLVTNTNDSGPGSLRQAIADSNSNIAEGNYIFFDPGVFNTPKTIVAASFFPTFRGEVTIIGPDSSLLTVSGANRTAPGSLFTVPPGAQVTIGGLSLTNADTCISNSGTLTLKDSVATNCYVAVNNASQGLAVVLNCDLVCANGSTNTPANADIVNAGRLIARNCAFEGSKYNPYAGSSYEVYNYNSAVADIAGCTFIGKSYGMNNRDSSKASVTDCTFVGNASGIRTYDTSSLTVADTTFILNGGSYGLVNAANAAVTRCTFQTYPLFESSDVPAMFNAGTATITNTTVAGAFAGLQNDNRAKTTITNCTLTRNSYGIFGEGAVTLRNSLVVGNKSTNIRVALSNASGNNITTGTPAEAGLEVDGDGNAALNYNGGETQTFALVNPSGTAVNAGNNAFISGDMTTDQRGEGYPRQSGFSVDIGAFELQQPAPSNAAPSGSES